MTGYVIPLKRSWTPFVVVTGLVVIPGFLAFMVTLSLPAIRTALDQPFSFEVWLWPVVLNVVMLGILGYLFENTLAQMRTTFTEHWIEQRGIVAKRVKWEEIRNIGGRGMLLTLKSHQTSISVNLWYYHDPAAALAVIQRRIPEDMAADWKEQAAEKPVGPISDGTTRHKFWRVLNYLAGTAILSAIFMIVVLGVFRVGSDAVINSLFGTILLGMLLLGVGYSRSR